MFKQILATGVIGVSFAISMPAVAHSYNSHHAHDYESIQPIPARHCVPGHKVNNRQARQHSRIQNGIHSGQLTHWEAKKLKRQQQHIRQAERRMRKDGCLTPYENKKLLQLLNKSSRYIRDLKHNAERRHYNRYDRHDRYDREHCHTC